MLIQEDLQRHRITEKRGKSKKEDVLTKKTEEEVLKKNTEEEVLTKITEEEKNTKKEEGTIHYSSLFQYC
jgi:hypothetical protein